MLIRFPILQLVSDGKVNFFTGNRWIEVPLKRKWRNNDPNK